MPRRSKSPSCNPPEPIVERLERGEVERKKNSYDMREIQYHYEALEKSKIGILTHVASQHSILDLLYGGDTGRPMPSWTYQTTPEVGVSDQQHTGRCWIFATLAVLGHVFRSQHGISNHRATFSEGYLGFWDLYEKSRLFLKVACDTRHMPLTDPSLCDLLKGGISDGGDYIFCLNLLDRYGIVPTEYYPNSSYGSMSTEALVTLLNQVLRDNAITLRTTGDHRLIPSMLTNVFAILCMGLGTPPAPWKKLDWQIDQCETLAPFAHELHVLPVLSPPAAAAGALPTQQAVRQATLESGRQATSSMSQPVMPDPIPRSALQVNPPPSGIVSSALPPEPVPWKPISSQTYPIKVPPKSVVQDDSLAALAAALGGETESTPVAVTREEPVISAPPSPVDSTATAPGLLEDDFEVSGPSVEIPSTTRVVTEENATLSGEPLLSGIRPPREVIPVIQPDRRAGCVDISSSCPRPGAFARVLQKLQPSRCDPVPREGSGEFFRETMPNPGCLLGRQPDRGCRLSHTINSMATCPPSERPVEEKAMSFDYTPREFYYRFVNTVRFVPVVCDVRYPPGTRIISNDANMYGGLPSLYLNISMDDLEYYAIQSLKRNIPVWFACDVKKQLTPEGGRMCNHIDRLNELLPIQHKAGTKKQEICHFNAIANHALTISAVSIKRGNPDAWRIVNSWGDIGRHAGIFVACGEWFREHVYSINVIYDTLHREHKADLDLRLKRPTVRLGPFDPSVI